MQCENGLPVRLILEKRQRKQSRKATAAIHPAPAKDTPTVEWTAETISKLKKLWPIESISAAQIGKRLGTTKSAIIGKAHRLHLIKRKNPIDMNAPKRESRHSVKTSRTLPSMDHPVSLPMVEIDTSVPTPAAVPVSQHPECTVFKLHPRRRDGSGCLWINGEGRGAKFCDADLDPRDRAHAYCCKHWERAISRKIAC